MNTIRIFQSLACVAFVFAGTGLSTAADHIVLKPIVTRPGALKGIRPVTPPINYIFTLNKIRITDTRSVHEDTDFASVALAIGNGVAQTSPAKSLGNLNNGTFTVSTSVSAAVGATQSAAFTYTVVNSGYNANTVEQDLKKWGGEAAQKGAAAGIAAAANALLPGSGSIASSAGSVATNWAVGKLLDVIFANCDGTVAAGAHVFSGAQLAAQTAGGKVITVTDNNPGTDSPTGCGSNSHYYATWSIRRS